MTRYRSLDGLRGVAALVVVVHHCLLTSIVLAATYRGGTTSGWGPSEVLARTPLHLLWDGTGMVLVFFVLSGFVLTLAFLKPPNPSWASFYVKRLPRLYLPVWGSLAFAAVLAVLVPRLVANDQSWWINAHAAPTTVTMVARDSTLAWTPSLLNSPLWSLQWEVAFSLLLPVYVFIAVRWKGLALLKICGALVLVGIGSKTGHASLLYMPVFVLGAVLAAERERLSRVVAHFKGWGWWAVGVVAVLLMTGDWIVGPLREWISRPMRSAGALLIVLLFLECPPVTSWASRRSLQWLGRISFSLYLIHEPLVVSLDRLLPGDNPWEVLAIALPLSLLVAAGFYRLVEAPSLRVSRWLGRVEARPTQFWAAT